MNPINIVSLATNSNPIHLTLDVGWVEKYKTVTGNPIVISDGVKETLLKKLQVALTPIQDLHGYDKPWVGGAGKNKLDEDILVNGNFDYEGSEYQLNVVTHGFVAIKSGQTYMWSQSGSVAGRYVRFYDANKVEQDTSARVSQYNAVNATFNTPSWAVYMRLLWYSPDGITASDIKALKPQIEEGSTATAWTPYTNICPISGWDEVETHIPSQGRDIWTSRRARSSTALMMTRKSHRLSSSMAGQHQSMGL